MDGGLLLFVFQADPFRLAAFKLDNLAGSCDHGLDYHDHGQAHGHHHGQYHGQMHGHAHGQDHGPEHGRDLSDDCGHSCCYDDSPDYRIFGRPPVTARLLGAGAQLVARLLLSSCPYSAIHHLLQCHSVMLRFR